MELQGVLDVAHSDDAGGGPTEPAHDEAAMAGTEAGAKAGAEAICGRFSSVAEARGICAPLSAN